MPSLRGVYDTHPHTGVPGVWVILTTPSGSEDEFGVAGAAAATYEALLDPSWDLATASASATVYAQAIVGPSVMVAVEATQLSPLLFTFTVTNPPRAPD